MPYTLLAAIAMGVAFASTAAAVSRTTFRFDLRDADARALARVYSDLTGHIVLVPSSLPGGKVTIHWPRALSRRHAQRLLLSAFESLSLTLVRRGRIWTLVPLQDAARASLPLYIR
jgi:type II secretory pathway component GspD/PulD (secretin)